jgi:sterol desaturase/sphingolipid hydroxylase (fatty acid hydroxylase superfamily)
MPHLSYILSAAISLTILAIALSGVGSVIAFYQRGGGNIRDYLRYLFPPDLVTRRSCYQDVGFILVKRLMRPFVATPLLLLTSVKTAEATYGALVLGFGPREQTAMPVVLFAILLIMALLLQDFLRFFSHYLLHQSSLLWDIHKVHHSATYLTPLTNHRVHIIEELLEQAVTGLSVGPLLGATAFVTMTSVSTNTLLGFDAYLLIDTLCFAMLRHSHIGLSFGRLECYLMSPKQHHLHHSIAQHHWNKNFGFLLSCWDRMFGTLCYADAQENIDFGISAEESRDYDSVLKLHFMPYVKLFRRRVLPAGQGETVSIVTTPDLIVQPKV